MPAFLTHMIGADKISARIENKRIQHIIEENYDAYQSGAQGGDYFYLYKYYSALRGHTYKMFGYALHNARIQRFFTEGATYVKEQNDDTLTAFFYGYITHYYLDMIVHPAINKIASDPMRGHNLMEYALDAMYARKNGIDAMAYDRSQFVLDTTVKGERAEQISRFFSTMHKKLYYGFRLKEHSYQTAYGYYAKFTRKMFQPGKWQIRWMKLQNPFIFLDVFSMLYYPYEEIKDLYDYEPFYALIEKGLERAIQFMEIVDGYLHDERNITVVESFLYNVNFHGKTIIPREERKIFKRMYRKAKLKLF